MSQAIVLKLYSMLLFTTIFLLFATFSHASKALRGDAEKQNFDGQITIGKHTYASRQEFISAGKRCGTKDLSEEKIQSVEKRLLTVPSIDVEKEFGTLARAPGQTRMATVNVHFHIISDTNGNGDLTDNEVQSQIDVINDDFHQVNAKFVLKGIHRVTNDDWFDLSYGSSEEYDMKSSLRVGGTNVLNVYSIANDEGILGWATFPVDVEDYLAWDGVVIDYRTLPGGSAAPYNEGATLTHEVGHWMGLYHTFQGGCRKYADQGDMVKDTPCVAQPNFGCPAETTNSCVGNIYQFKGNDLIHNYMDYTDDSCMSEFTAGQKQRMRLNWLAYRKNNV